MKHKPSESRYEKMVYQRCGSSGLKLPRVSLGLWHNFGGVDDDSNSRRIILKAFDLGITHFDLANNYGPPPGSAETIFGRVLKNDLALYRDELIISSKAGYDMWPGPYGDYGSRKYLIASLDQSLKRMGVDYVDIFYHHRPDPETPLEETMGALDHIVRSGKALYAGISNYAAKEAARAISILKEMGTPCLIHQPNYSMFDRWIEDGLLSVLKKKKVGCIVFSPLEQGLLTNRYLRNIPRDSRAAKAHGYLQKSSITPEVITTIHSLNEIAEARGQSLAQMAISWVLRDPAVTSAVVGASKVKQIEEIVKAVENTKFSSPELKKIDKILK